MQISKAETEKDNIGLLIDAMRADYGERFIRQFQEEGHFLQFKRRLRKVLNGYTAKEVVAGYNEAVKLNPGYVPTIPEIERSCRVLKNWVMKAERERQGLKKLKALPSPSLDARKKAILDEIRAVLK